MVERHAHVHSVDHIEQVKQRQDAIAAMPPELQTGLNDAVKWLLTSPESKLPRGDAQAVARSG